MNNTWYGGSRRYDDRGESLSPPRRDGSERDRDREREGKRENTPISNSNKNYSKESSNLKVVKTDKKDSRTVIDNMTTSTRTERNDTEKIKHDEKSGHKREDDRRKDNFNRKRT